MKSLVTYAWTLGFTSKLRVINELLVGTYWNNVTVRMYTYFNCMIVWDSFFNTNRFIILYLHKTTKLWHFYKPNLPDPFLSGMGLGTRLYRMRISIWRTLFELSLWTMCFANELRMREWVELYHEPTIGEQQDEVFMHHQARWVIAAKSATLNWCSGWQRMVNLYTIRLCYVSRVLP